MQRLGPHVATIVALAVILSAVAGPAGAAAQAPCAGAEKIATDEASRRRAAATILCLVNTRRRSAGVPVVRTHSRLAGVAQRLSSDMVRRKFIGHVDSSGRNLRTRIARSGYVRRSSGEIIQWGTGAQRTPAALMRKIMASPRHRPTVISSRFRDVGVGLVLGAPVAGKPNGATLTLTFGRRT